MEEIRAIKTGVMIGLYYGFPLITITILVLLLR